MIRNLWMWFLARFRLSDSAICEMSRGRGHYDDYHDYKDTVEQEPWHFMLMECRRCGKEFYI